MDVTLWTWVIAVTGLVLITVLGSLQLRLYLAGWCWARIERTWPGMGASE